MQKNDEKKTITLLPSQHETLTYLYDPNVRELLTAGSAGSSKSFAVMTYAIRLLCEFPDTRVGLFRNRLTDTLKTTVKTMYELLAMLNIPESWMTFDKLTNVFSFQNGSEIYLLSSEYRPSDPNYGRWGGYEFTIIIFEEASEQSKKAYDIAKTRCRYKPESLKEYNFTHKAICVSNPDINSWLYEYFYLKFRNGTLPEHIKYVHSKLEDNPYLDEDYKQSMRDLPEVEYRRLYLGEWVAQSNDVLILQHKLDSLFEPLDLGEYKATHISVDVARMGDDASIICVWSNLICIKIIKLEKKKLNVLIAEVKRIMNEYNIHGNKVIFDLDGVGGVADFIAGSIGIHNNAVALNKENFQNIKTQLYYKFAELVDDIRIICDSDTAKAIKKEFGAIDRIIQNDEKWKITKKDDIKRKIGKSPDFADALIYGMYFNLKNNTGEWHLY